LSSNHRHEPLRYPERDQRDGRLIRALGKLFEDAARWSTFATLTLNNGDPEDFVPEPVIESGVYACYQADPRLQCWEPSSRWNSRAQLPSKNSALPKIEKFLLELQEEAGRPLGWVVAESFGRIGGRWHCHVLIAGASHINMFSWWRRALERFGRCKISKFRKNGGAGYYMAQNALGRGGDFHFGGKLFDVVRPTLAPPPVGRVVIAQSADVPSALFHMTLGRGRKR
jgi:hypothetical protein